ncbi:polysaccharide pyruvyl transferase family protein [Ketogulonicigenium vulgare]|uniref:Xanthan biosynthesis pyruvyltransferase GumL n=1 Tax=Ketogulonicigenium vulgare (strain WSH-001) TaxID=759362 RepID=F9Y548_KETVW|nr:polysaccharide pyruvyl transferase family protein [Ketogulonicigenium vulgare]ADO42481.1 ExoV-like protein [Ketogulonicigenium vulgare Y25]AEM40680.1 Xanthan biosynthesis pyruvyltransferase GumL [Ketogulonicigenium vulgare WSH-001]ALJ80851.1 polysaccharide biosynthesis protein GumL [Ketogulonicigenium vulgare]AOZ54394.1 ExoV-like protein [Ketogulonicigenium vulgare]
MDLPTPSLLGATSAHAPHPVTTALPAVPFRYYNTIRNSGDAVTSYILQQQLGVSGRVVTSAEPHLLGIGSIFFMANPQSHIWGSGVMSPEAQAPSIDPLKVHALRGKKTLAWLRERGFDIGDVPLGDAGIFVDGLVSDRTNRYRAAVVPHHSSFYSPKWDKARDNPEMVIVDMMDDSMLPIEQIAQSEVVISASLHGLIYAAAFGKPHVWISGHSSDTWNFKFRDWFSMCENGQDVPVLMDQSFEEMMAMAEIRPHVIDRAALLAAFPRFLAEDTPIDRLSFQTARAHSPVQVYIEPGNGEYSGKDFAHKLRELRSKAFANALEPTYIAFTHVNVAQAPSRALLLAAQRYLDVHRSAGFAWIPGQGAQNGDFSLSETTFIDADFSNGTIVMRPDGYISGNQKFAYI